MPLLDELFVQLSAKGLAEALESVNVFKEKVAEAREQLTTFTRGSTDDFGAFQIDLRVDSSELLTAVRGARALNAELKQLAKPVVVRITRRIYNENLPTAELLPTAQRLPTAKRLGNGFPILNRADNYPVAKPLEPSRVQAIVPVRITNLPLLVKFAGGGSPGSGFAGPGAGVLGLGGQAKAATSAMDMLNDRIQQFGRVAQYAFAAGTASILGFVRAGLAGSVQGFQLHHQFVVLSREVASVFFPVVRRITAEVARVVNWFRRLDGEGQAQVRRWILTGGAVLGVAALLPRVVVGLQGVAVAATQAATALLGMQAAAAGPIGIAVAAAAAYVVALGAAFAVAYVRSAELRAATSELFTAIGAGLARLQPLIDVFLTVLTDYFVTQVRLFTVYITAAINTFAAVWNNTMDAAAEGMNVLVFATDRTTEAVKVLIGAIEKLQSLPGFQTLSALALVGGAAQFLGQFRGLFAEIKDAAKQLKVGPAVPPRVRKKGQDDREDWLGADVGAESLEASFRRIADAVALQTSGVRDAKAEKERQDQQWRVDMGRDVKVIADVFRNPPVKAIGAPGEKRV